MSSQTKTDNSKIAPSDVGSNKTTKPLSKLARKSKSQVEIEAYRQFIYLELPSVIYKPPLTAKHLMPFCLVLGIIFIPIGVILIHSSYTRTLLEHDYTYCQSMTANGTCAELIESRNETCQCSFNITIPHQLSGRILIYSELDNFYQNSRMYVSSKDSNQLLGIHKAIVKYTCYPYDYRTEDDKRNPIGPCGALANSLFNDTFHLYMNDALIKLKKKGIAISDDKKYNYHNPSPHNNLKAAFQNYSKPFNWKRPAYELSHEVDNNGYRNEHFIVWMKPATFPRFRKLYAHLDELSPGNYTVVIDYNFPVIPFIGRKFFVLTQSTLVGGKNAFLGLSYLLAGILMILAFFALLYVYITIEKPSKLIIEALKLKSKSHKNER